MAAQILSLFGYEQLTSAWVQCVVLHAKDFGHCPPEQTRANGTIQSFGVVVVSLPVSRTSNAQEFLWEFPELSLRIQISFKLIERLREEILRAAPQAGEIGGLLIGKRPPPNSVIEIMDAIAVPAEGVQPAGNFVIRSDALKRIIDQYSFGDRTVIGFYRSHSGQRICLRPQDLALIEQWFKDPSDVFLVIRPHDGRASAGFFYWQDGSVFGDFALTFPLSEAELKSPSWKSLISGSKHAEWFPLLLARARAAKVRLGASRNWLLACGVVALLLLIAIGRTRAGFESGLKNRVSSRESSHALRLRVEQNGLRALVTWDRSAPEVANASEANLLIWDGPRPPIFRPLSLTELRSGSIDCTFINDTVKVRLDVMGAGGNAKTDSASLISGVDRDRSLAVSGSDGLQASSSGLKSSNPSSASSERTRAFAAPQVGENPPARLPTSRLRPKNKSHRAPRPKSKILAIPRLP